MKAIFIFMMLVLLTGCSEESTEDAPIQQSVTEESNQHVDVENPQQEEATSEEQSKTTELTGEINVFDPVTNSVIATFSTTELGYHTDYYSYVNQIKKLAKDLAQGTDSTEGYDQRMFLDKVNENGELIKGQPMVILKESELVERILEISPNGGNVELPIYITETGYDRSEFDSLEEVIIASYTTYFKASDVGRTHNIRQSSDAISKVIVGNGDYFSFNTMVGPRTKETGYQEALEIVNGEFVLGIGGGICQTSSTLFNAVDQLSVEYVEWHHHSRDIGYVPKGRDATVSYGTLDFRFHNTTGFPFMIISTTTENSLTIEIRTSEHYTYH